MLLGGEIKLGKRVRSGQHLYALSTRCTTPARARYRRPNVDCRRLRRAAVHDAELSILPIAREEHIEDDRDIEQEGDPVLLIIEDDPHYARILLGLARDKGFKGIVAQQGRRRRWSLARQFQADGDLARYLPAGYARLDGAQPAEARSGDAPYPGADRHAGGGAPARAVTWRVLAYLIKEPTTDGLEMARSSGIKDFTHRAPNGCSVVEDNDIERKSIVELLGTTGHRDW